MAQDGEVRRNCRGHPFDYQLLESADGSGDRGGAVLAPHDELADEVVVVLANRVAGLIAGVEPDAEAIGCCQPGDGAGRRQELAARRVLGVDPDFDAMAAALGRNLLLGHRQGLAAGDADLPFDEVDTGDHLSDRVLDLEAGVHFEEEELTVLVDELDRSGVVIADGLCRLYRSLAHGLLHAGAHATGWGLFDELLVATLGRAVARAYPHHVAELVADDLYLDVAGPGEVTLDVDLVAAEKRLRLTLGAVHRLLHLVGASDHLHPSAASAERGLDGEGVAVLCAEGEDVVDRFDELGGAGDDRGATAKGSLAAAHLVAHLVDCLRRRTDEGHSLGRDSPREVGVLAEEAVAGVDPIGAALVDGVEDRLSVEVALRRSLPAQGKSLVGEADMEGVAIEFAVDRNGLDAQLSGGPDDPDGDLSTVGDQDLGKHRWQSWRNGHPYRHLIERMAGRMVRRGGGRDR